MNTTLIAATNNPAKLKEMRRILGELGIDARVIMPYHRVIKEKYADKTERLFYFYVQLGWRREYAGIEKLELDGVTDERGMISP